MGVYDRLGNIQLVLDQAELACVQLFNGMYASFLDLSITVDKAIEMRNLLSAKIDQMAALPGKETVSNVAE
jgi:hypothetical protein